MSQFDVLVKSIVKTIFLKVQISIFIDNQPKNEGSKNMTSTSQKMV